MSTALPLTESRLSLPVIHRNLMEIVWKHKSLVALGLFAGLVLGGLAYMLWPPVYQSKAQILVIKRRPDIITGIDTRNLVIEDYVATHKALIESPTIIKLAIDKRDLTSLSSLRNAEFPIETIQKSLTVTRNRSAGSTNNNSVLDLALRARDDTEAAQILLAIIESYNDYMEETYRDTSDDTVKLITEARNVLKKDLRDQEDAYRLFRKEAPVLLTKNRDGTTLTQERFGSIELKRSALLVKKAELQGYIDSIDTALKGEGNREAVLAMAHEWQHKLEGDGFRPERLTLSNQLLPLLMEEQRLLETRGENHAEVEALRKRIETTRQFLSSPSSPFKKGNGSEDGLKVEPKGGVNAGANPVVQAGIKLDPKDSLHQAREYFVQYLNHVAATERFFTDLRDSEFKTAREMSNYEVEDEKHRRDIMLTEKLLDTIVKRLEDVNLVKNVGGYDAKTIAPPIPGKKIHPNGLIIFPVALFLGAILGCWLAYFAEINDKSFRDVDDVRARLGLPVVGQIPFLKVPEAPAQAGQLAPILYSHHNPKSLEAESYRGVRTALYFNTLNKEHQIVQITSSNISEGKSTLASNLAVSIAQSGKQVLLLDGDMRRPTIHQMFALSNEHGLSSVIVDEAEWKEVIQPSAIRNLSIMTAGPIPPNPADLLTSPRFDSLLTTLRDQYEFVIIDTPPLLAVTDPSIIAHKVDMVLYNIRFTKNAGPDAERGRDVLASLKAKVVGVVVNDADALLKNSGYAYGYGYSEYADAKPAAPAATAPAAREVKAPR